MAGPGAVDLTTTYLGLRLSSPIVASASPVTREVDGSKALADAGVGAIVLPSLFEEEIVAEEVGLAFALEAGSEHFAEALDYFPDTPTFSTAADLYLELLEQTKKAVDVPVIASLNASSTGGWSRYAKLLADAGADALELNVYRVPTSPELNAAQVEQIDLALVSSVCAGVSLPVAVKLSPYYSSMASFAARVLAAGAAGLVLFNRFYQPDLDIEALEVEPSLNLSSPSTLRLRLRWLGMLYSQIGIPMAVSGGVHDGQGAIKATMAGATAIQMVSALLMHGPEHLKTTRLDMVRWMEEHEYESLDQMRGSLSLTKCPNPQAFERANYMRVLAGWKA